MPGFDNRFHDIASITISCIFVKAYHRLMADPWSRLCGVMPPSPKPLIGHSIDACALDNTKGIRSLPSKLHILLDIRPQRLWPLKRCKVPSLIVTLEEDQIARLRGPGLRNRTKLMRKVRVSAWLADMIQCLLLSIRIDTCWETVS